MDAKLLSRFEKRWVQVEYGHPLRGGTFGKLDRAYLLKVFENTVVFVVHVEERTQATPQALVPGAQPSQSNLQTPNTIRGQYTMILIECQHIIGFSCSGPVEYMYQRETLQQSGTRIEQTPVKLDNSAIYHLRHGNWEKWEEIFQKAFQDELELLGLVTKKEMSASAVEEVENKKEPLPQTEIVTGETEKL